QIAYSENVSIEGCNISSNEFYGLYLWQSPNNDIIKNNVSSNKRHGIYLKSSSFIKIMDNTVSSNDKVGILFSYGDRNKIIGNDISFNNLSGLYLSMSIWNKIYHNNFISNLNQANETISFNFWNDTYPSGGNYWSDFSPTCQDFYDGSTTPQTSGSPDDICDNKYDIEINGADYYPLTIPYVQVLPPTNLQAELTGNNFENVTISWDASLDDPSNVTKYAVYYYSTIYNPTGSNYNFLTELSASGASRYNLTIQGFGVGDIFSRFFYVQANTSIIFRFAKSSNQVAKFAKGYNYPKPLISIPLILNNSNISHVLRNVEFGIAWYYNNSDLLDPWKSYNPSKTFNDLKTVNRTMALLMDFINDSFITIAGVVPKITNITLKAGWNFVGFPSLTRRRISNALSGISYERIEGFIPAPPQYLWELDDNDFMRPGYGYWIKVSSDTVWRVTN
ncbi:MAG: right-handed parallel beta-helix repeat-containing protein, partial [Thermoplasmata archaeon]